MKLLVKTDMPVCQDDYPLDWYQKEFLPYAEDYQALPDRDILTTLVWMEPYIEAAKKSFWGFFAFISTLLHGRRNCKNH